MIHPISHLKSPKIGFQSISITININAYISIRQSQNKSKTLCTSFTLKKNLLCFLWVLFDQMWLTVVSNTSKQLWKYANLFQLNHVHFKPLRKAQTKTQTQHFSYVKQPKLFKLCQKCWISWLIVRSWLRKYVLQGLKFNTFHVFPSSTLLPFSVFHFPAELFLILVCLDSDWDPVTSSL